MFHPLELPLLESASPLSSGSENEIFSPLELSNSPSKMAVAGPKNVLNPKGYSSKLKTELCKTHSLGLVCPYGESCSFAHGTAELKSKTLVPSRYKTIKCRDFHGNGYCKFGSRCQFLHRERRTRQKLKKMSYQSVLSTFEEVSALAASEPVERVMNKSLNLAAYCLSRLSVFQSFSSPL